MAPDSAATAMPAVGPPPARLVSNIAMRSAEFWSAARLVIRDLIDEGTAHHLEEASRLLPSRRVICGDPDMSWDEQAVPRTHAIHRLFAAADMLDAVRALVGGTAGFEDLVCWVSRYRANEHIPRHTDRSGSLQILLMLRPVDAADGGALMLDAADGEHAIRLDAGDALFFRATSLPHWTIPFRASSREPDRRRVVAVARYFFASETE